MPIRNYVIIDGKKYRAIHGKWIPVPRKPMTVRYTLHDTVDVTYGPGVFKEWQGPIEAPVTPDDASWGTIDDIRTSLAKRQGVTYEDHYGDAYTAHIQGPFPEASLQPVWDGVENKFQIVIKVTVE